MKQNSRASFSYAFVIVAVLFTGLVASFGMRAAFGAYISPWEQDFSVSRTVVTAISMLGFVVYALGQPLAGKLNDQFGKNFVPATSILLIGISLILTSRANHIWQIFVLFGFFFSLGVAGCAQPMTAAIITNWFDKKRGFALGLTASGMAVGQLILVPANLFIIDKLGWRTAMAALGAIIIITAGPLFVFFLRSKPEEKGLLPYGYEEVKAGVKETTTPVKDSKKSLPVFSVLKQKDFYLLTIPYFICGFTDVGVVQTHLIPMTQGNGFSVSTVALAFSLIAIFNIAGTIVTGHMSDYFSRKRQLAIIYTIRALTYILLITLREPWLLLIFAAIYGAMEMASIAPTTSLAVQLFDGYGTGALLGVVSISHQLGGAFGSWIPGLLYDITNSYTVVLTMSVVLLITGAIMVLRVSEDGNTKWRVK